MSTLQIHTLAAPDIVKKVTWKLLRNQINKRRRHLCHTLVFGDDINGEFVKPNARAFLFKEFGDSAEIFSLRLHDPALFQNVQDVVWKELLKPRASQTAGIDNERFAEQEEEGKMIWDQLLHTKPGVHTLCIRAAEQEAATYQIFKQKRNRIVETFGTLCIRSLEFIFVRPLLESLDMFNDFRTSVVEEDGHSISKFDALFEFGPLGRIALQKFVVCYCVSKAFFKTSVA